MSTAPHEPTLPPQPARLEATASHREAYRGVIAAPVLPFVPDGGVDWACLDNYADWLVAQGPIGIAVNMAAGEVHALTAEERRRVLERYVERVGDRILVVAGIAAGSTAQAIAGAREARDLGAHAVVPFPPLPAFLGKPLPDELPYRYHRAIAEAAGLPVIVFQVSASQGPQYGEALLRRLASIEQVVAIKDGTFETSRLLDLLRTLHAEPDAIAVLTGGDQTVLEGLLHGADGALIALASTLTAEIVQMHAAASGGGVAEAWGIWERIGPLARYAWRPPLRDYRARMKEVLVAQGLFRHATVREPLPPIAPDERRRLHELARLAGAIV